MHQQLETPKDHIERLRKEREKNDANSTTLANTLDKDINTAFKGENKFVLELLQNADDAAIQEHDVTINIIHIDDYLIFCHNATPFSFQDIEKICDNAQQKYRDKIEDNTKTGYKGIGFKAIFSIASCVTILSADQYCFRFDQDYYAMKDMSQKRYPWPIIPLWTERDELTDKIRDEITKISNHNHATIFVMKLRKEVNLEEQIAYFRNDPESIIFLRHVSTINFSSSSKQWHLSRHTIDNNQIQITIDGKPHSRWLLQRKTYSIPAAIKQAMQNESNFACPERLKTATATTITLAAQMLENGQLTRLVEGRFFSYLPTQFRCELPTLINGDFLLNAERTQLIENDWNKFLIGQVVFSFFLWMAGLAQNDQFYKQILKLLPPVSLQLAAPWIRQRYSETHRIAKSQIACLPSHTNRKQLLTLSEAVYDETDFYRLFPEIASDRVLISYDLEDTSLVRNMLNSIINLQDVLSKLMGYLRNNHSLEFQLRILTFFSNIIHYYKQMFIDNILLDDQHQQLQPLRSLYFWTVEIDLPIAIDIKFIHPKLCQSATIKQFLKDLGVQDFNGLMFIRGPLVKLLADKNRKLSAEETRKIHFFLANHRNQFTEQDLQQIRMLPIETITGRLMLADRCYLSDAYNPSQKIQAHASTMDIFVSEVYLKQHTNNMDWRAYFLQLHVSQQVTLRILPRIELREIKILLPKLGDAYVEAMKSHFKLTSEDVVIENFPYIELLYLAATNGNYLENIIWKKINSMASELESNSTRLNINSSRSIYDIIQFLFRTNLIIRSENDNALHKSTELFYDGIEPGLHRFLNIAKLPIKQSKALANYIGLKTELKITDCLTLLSEFDQQNITTKHLYEIIFKQILILSNQISTSDRQKIAEWQGRLLAYDGKLHDKKSLFLFNLTLVSIDPSSYWFMRFKNIPMSELSRLTTLFGIPTLSDKDVLVHTGEIKEDLDIKARIHDRCVYIAAIMAKETERNANELLAEYRSKITAARFVLAESLCLKHKANPSIVVQSLLTYKIKATLYLDSGLGICSDTIKNITAFIDEHLCLNGTAKELLGSIIELEEEKLVKTLARKGFTLEILEECLNTPTSSPASTMPSSKSTVSLSDTNFTNASIAKNVETKQRLPSSSPIASDKVAPEDDNLVNQLQALNIEPDLEVPTKFSPTIAVEQCKMKGNSIKKMSFMSSQTVESESHLASSRAPTEPNVSNKTPSSAVTTEKTQTSSNERMLSAGQKKALGDIGKWAEAYVFHRLRAHYQEKYPHTEIKDTATGFTFKALSKRLGLVTYQLIWHNKHQESGASRDFTLVKGNEEKVIEVKGTVKRKGVVHITGSEYKEMRTYQSRYRLFRVTNVGQEIAEVQKLKNPAQIIQNNAQAIQKIELKW